MTTSTVVEDIAAVVGRAVEHDEKLSDEAGLLILAALDGDEALADLSGFQPTQPPPPAEQAPAEPTGAFLRKITVRGFRGIGPESSLELSPSPGLTVVAGRNGSGKSSFCEGLEVALTGDTARWRAKSSTLWKDAWRNLHHAEEPSVIVTLAEEAVGSTTVTAGWPTGGTYADLQSWTQRQGAHRELGLASLGWTKDLETYRPLLTYEELGGILAAEPSRLYDALSEILGLGVLADAIKRLTTRHAELAAPGKQVAALKKDVLAALTTTDDDRAVLARKLVAARKTDWSALQALATGTGDSTTALVEELRAVLALALPESAEVDRTVERLRVAISAQVAVGGQVASMLDRQLRVVLAALALHDHDGDSSCPVCGVGQLDTVTAGRLRDTLADSQSAVEHVNRARAELESATQAVRGLLQAVPAALAADHADLQPQRSATAEHWQAWTAAPTDPLALVDHVEATFPTLVAAVAELKQAATRALGAVDEAWAPVAAQLATYVDLGSHWAEQTPTVATTKEALDWLKDHDLELKNQRLQPIAAHAMSIWSSLRQESNVEIADLTLEGTNTRRRVEIRSNVDGEKAPGLTVLSQGELHALALALFLPRAAAPESPFRFIVLDDPVQAMDPSKIDGLLQVLTELARTRQVVVFSHDDRLANAVRQGGVVATILEVTRETGSVVSVTPSLDPGARYLSDALSMARDPKLPESTKSRLLPGMLRMAVEAVAREKWFAAAISRGESPTAVGETWDAAKTTRSRLGLALKGRGGDAGPWLTLKPHRRLGMVVCTADVHNGLSSEPDDACWNVKALIADLRRESR